MKTIEDLVLTSAAYTIAQEAMAQLRSAIHQLLSEHPAGLSEGQIGLALGLKSAQIEDSSTIAALMLALMEAEGAIALDSAASIWKVTGTAAADAHVKNQSKYDSFRVTKSETSFASIRVFTDSSSIDSSEPPSVRRARQAARALKVNSRSKKRT